MQWFKGIFFAGLSRHQASITGSAAHRRRTAAGEGITRVRNGRRRKERGRKTDGQWRKFGVVWTDRSAAEDERARGRERWEPELDHFM